ncbi:MAG: hypothetical protein II980_05675 [Clostridia bacterium]|nr:hypothetical protein [Clostridia bacterium]
MSTTELNAKLRELKRLKAKQDELSDKISSIEAEIKAYMGDNEELRTGTHKITYKGVESSRVDTKAMKKELPEIVARYTVSTFYKRLIIA